MPETTCEDLATIVVAEESLRVRLQPYTRRFAYYTSSYIRSAARLGHDRNGIARKIANHEIGPEAEERAGRHIVTGPFNVSSMVVTSRAFHGWCIATVRAQRRKDARLLGNPVLRAYNPDFLNIYLFAVISCTSEAQAFSLFD